MGISNPILYLLLILGCTLSAAEFTPRYRNLWALTNPSCREPLTLEAANQGSLPQDFSLESWGAFRARSKQTPMLYDWVQDDLLPMRDQLVARLDLGLILLPKCEVGTKLGYLPTRNLIEYALRGDESLSPAMPEVVWPLAVCEFKWGSLPKMSAILGSGQDQGYRSFASLLTADIEAAQIGLFVDTRLEMFGGVFDIPLDDTEHVLFPLVYTPVYTLRGPIVVVRWLQDLSELNQWLAQNK